MASFVEGYNHTHRHTGIRRNTPADVHYGCAAAKSVERSAILAVARAWNPEWFSTSNDPKILALSGATWINEPAEQPVEETDPKLAVPGNDGGEKIHAITGVGADFSVDTTGNLNVVHSLVERLNMGGKAALVGLSAPGTEDTIDHNTLILGRTIVGVIMGDAVPQVFIPQLIALHRAGKFTFRQARQAIRLRPHQHGLR